jgi:small-conductance mechanosensitive channel
MFEINLADLPPVSLMLRSVSLFCFLIAFLIVFKTIVVKYLIRMARKTKNHIDDILIYVINDISWFFYIGFALFISLQLFEFTALTNQVINICFTVLISYQVVRSGSAIIKKGAERVIIHHKKTHPKDDISIILFISKLLKLGLWLIGIILILSNLGYNVTSLIAGLGIGGIAIALAVQNILSDIFSSFSIYLDKPFRVGDYIELPDHKGTVKHIGIKTTRLMTPRGEELVVPNKILIESYIQNFKKMEHRRVISYLNVDFDGTPINKIEMIPELVRTVIDVTPHNDVERVYLKKIYGNQLLFEVTYVMTSQDYQTYIDTRQQINMTILRLFKKHRIKLSDTHDLMTR